MIKQIDTNGGELTNMDQQNLVPNESMKHTNFDSKTHNTEEDQQIYNDIMNNNLINIMMMILIQLVQIYFNLTDSKYIKVYY